MAIRITATGMPTPKPTFAPVLIPPSPDETGTTELEGLGVAEVIESRRPEVVV